MRLLYKRRHNIHIKGGNKKAKEDCVTFCATLELDSGVSMPSDG